MLRRKYKKSITFLVQIKKELANSKIITYKWKLIDSFKFVSSSLSNFFDNLSEELHNKKS